MVMILRVRVSAAAACFSTCEVPPAAAVKAGALAAVVKATPAAAVAAEAEAAAAAAAERKQAMRESAASAVKAPPPMDAQLRQRMQGVLDALDTPLDVAVDFALKYAADGRHQALADALPLWEEAAAAMTDLQQGARKGGGATALQRERCRDASEALERIGDVATVGGVPFEAAIAAAATA